MNKLKSRFCDKMVFITLLTVALLAAILLTGCGGCEDNGRLSSSGHQVDHRKPLAWGHEQTIYVFADDQIWMSIEQDLRASIERYYFTTENETYFDLKRADFGDIDQFFRFKNLIFFAQLDSPHDVSKYVTERLGGQVIENVRQNRVGMYTRTNLWANDQFVVFLIGDTLETLSRYAMLQRESIFESYRNILFSRLSNKIFSSKVHPESLFRGFSWRLRIPDYYAVYRREIEGNFISLLARRRDNPDRYISVYSEELSKFDYNLDWVIETRSRLAWDYYDEDEFARSDVRSMTVDFDNHEAIRLAGRWQNRKHAVGGAFTTFSFYEESTGSAYLIDNSVFYPQGFKLPALIELEIISRTIEILKNDGQL